MLLLFSQTSETKELFRIFGGTDREHNGEVGAFDIWEKQAGGTLLNQQPSLLRTSS